MLKKLRRQFIVSNMLLVGIVIVSVFSALTFISYSYEAKQSEAALRSVLESNTGVVLFEDGGIFITNVNESADAMSNSDTSNDKKRNVFLIAVTDSQGSVVESATTRGMNIDSDILKKVVKLSLKNDDEVGIIHAYSLRYMKLPTETGGYKIAFADRSEEIAALNFMVKLYIFTTMFILSLMFLISDYMAHKAISPVERSWYNQRRFVADASHELKTPLTVILANMDIMQSNSESTVEEQKKWIENTRSEANRMTQLVNDMLFLAKSDAAAPQTYNFMNTNFSSLVEDSVLTFESVAFEKGINFISEIAPDAMAFVDQAKMKQTIIILLDNAMKYVSDKGSVFVNLTFSSKYVRLLVVNTGATIPREKQKHIFERFFRVDDSRSRDDRGGSGLGLSIAENIVSAHKGKLALEYSDERGTCFSLTIPTKNPSTRKAKKG